MHFSVTTFQRMVHRVLARTNVVGSGAQKVVLLEKLTRLMSRRGVLPSAFGEHPQ